MNSLGLLAIKALVMGLGATLTLDLWAVFLDHAFKIAPSNYCLLGRWIRHLPEGTLRHASIALAPRKRAECTVGWIAHYSIGILFASAFVGFAGRGWLAHPTPLPALVFGILTVAAPFLVMQPAFGLGVAASRAPSPRQARLRSLMNHAVFGVGLYLFGLLAGWLLWA